MAEKVVYTREEIEALLRACGPSKSGRRNRMLVVVLWRTGMRISEALALRGSDLDRSTWTLRIRAGKGDKARTCPLGTEAWDMLSTWLVDRVTRWPNPQGFLFVTRHGTAIDPAYVRQLLPRLGRQAGIDKRVHAHGFRHTFAAELSREGSNPVNIQRLLGHESLKTTDTYLSDVGCSAELIAMVRARPSIETPATGPDFDNAPFSAPVESTPRGNPRRLRVVPLRR